MRNPTSKTTRVTSYYGMRTLNGVTAPHNGIDLVPADGTKDAEIVAVCDGTVTAVVSNVPDSHTGLNVTKNTAGNSVTYKTSDGYSVIYHHLKAGSVCVKVGDKVKPGDKIGVMGTTGKSTGIHLHYEFRDPKGATFDPAPYIGTDKAFPACNPAYAKPVLRKGSKGEDVKLLQKLLGGLAVDGVFGSLTEKAVMAFQQKNKLVADGICGPKTWTALGV